MTYDAHDLDARDGARDEGRPGIDLEAYAVATRADPPPVWRTLDLVRDSSFTGEVVFESSPEVRAYFDRGEVYYAEPAGVPPIGQRLVDAGVVDVGQLRRGTVRVGDVEHLGRLFDREPSVDRDAAVLVVERETEATVAVIADDHWSIRVSPYRHHPSGVHRWFVAPVHPSLVPRPLSAVAQVDRTVIDELPTLGTGADHARIEWDEPGPFAGLDAVVAGRGTAPGLDVDWSELEPFDGGAHLDAPTDVGEEPSFDASEAGPHAPDAPGSPAPAGGTTDVSTGAGSDDFQLVWPDGTEETPVPLPPTVLEELQADEPEIVIDEVLFVTESFVRYDVGSHADLDDVPASDPSRRADDAGPTTVAEPTSGVADRTDAAVVTPAVVEQLPPPGTSVPEDVADAVRRALTAIEAVSAGSTLRSTLPPVDPDDLVADDDVLPPPTPFAPPSVAGPVPAPPVPPAPLAVSAPGSTAPPSGPPLAPPEPGTSAATGPPPSPPVAVPAAPVPPGSGETIGDVARQVGPEAAPETAVEPTRRDVARPVDPDEGIRPPVVFLDDEAEAVERTGALRRLIDSLRRKR